MKKIYSFGFAILLASIISGCDREPVACFKLDIDGSVVKANPACSQFEDAYTWDFGDGYTSIARNPEHRYANPGSYEVTLQVKNGNEIDSRSQSIFVQTYCRTCNCSSGGVNYPSSMCGTLQDAQDFCSLCNIPGFSCGCG